MAAPTETMPAASTCVFQAPFADLTLRAGADGATARVHRGVVAFQSRVFLDALSAADAPPEELPLPSKSADDLKLLTAFMYPRWSRTETFAGDTVSASLAASTTYPSCSPLRRSGCMRTQQS